MANTTFDGPVRSRSGFQSIGPGAVPALTLATDLTVKDHAGRLLTMDPTGTPTAITIPAINASTDSASAGPGQDPNNPSTIGTTFEILFIDDFTGTIKTANTADKFVGGVTIGIDASVAGKQFMKTNCKEHYKKMALQQAFTFHLKLIIRRYNGKIFKRKIRISDIRQKWSSFPMERDGY